VGKKGKSKGVRAKRPSSSPDSEQGKEAGAASAGGGRRRPRGRRQPREGENREGIEGISTPCLPWAGIACGGGSAASGGDRLWWLGWWCLEAWEVGRFSCDSARRGGEPRKALYRRGKAVRGRYFQRGSSPAKAVLRRGRDGRSESRSPGDWAA
jgi:hypothetical protein